MRKNIKKATSLALVMVMAASLAACGGSPASGDGGGSKESQASGEGSGDSAGGDVTLRFSWWGAIPGMKLQKKRLQLLRLRILIFM